MIRTMNIVALIVTVLFSYGLYSINDDTDMAERGISKLRQEIDIEIETLKVLRAEWSHLNQPVRIQQLAAKYLDLVPIGLHQIVGIQDVPARPFDAEREHPGLMVQTPESLNSKRSQREELISSPVIMVPQPKPIVLTRGGDANG